MNLEDLIKLAGVTKSPYDTPVQEQPTEIEEQPVMDDAEGMRTLIALVTPEQLNQLQGQAPVEEEGFANSGDEYAGEPEEYKGTLGSPADLSLRRYLGANGVPVNVDETKVYEDHKVEDIKEAWKSYKLDERPSDFAKMLGTRPPDAIGPKSKPKAKADPDPMGGMGEPAPAPTPPQAPTPAPDPMGGMGEPGPGPDPQPAPKPVVTPPEPKDPMGGMGEPSGPNEPAGTRPPDAIGPKSTPKATTDAKPDANRDAPAKDKAPEVTDQMRADAQRYADEYGMPMDQIGKLVSGTVGGEKSTLAVDKFGTVIDMKTGDVIGGDEADAARAKAGVKSESLQRIEYLAGLNESYTIMERPSDRSRRGTRPPDAIGPGIIQPKVGEPIEPPRQPKPKTPSIIDPSAGDPVMPGISSADLDGDMPDEPSKPMPGIDPKDLDGDMPADPDTPDMGKDVFGRDKAELAKLDAMFKKYGLTPPKSALMQSAVNEEPNEANKFIKAKIDAEKEGEDSFTVDGRKYKVKDSADLERLRQLAGTQQVDEAPFPGEYDYSDDKYDADGAVTGVGKQNYDMRFAKWSEDTPSELMMVIKKYDLGPDDAYQMATADVNADIDAIADLHDEFVDRTGSDSDIDSGDEWLASPEYDKVMTMVGDLCSAMGMEGAGREECGKALMKHVDENAPKESTEINDLKKLAGI